MYEDIKFVSAGKFVSRSEWKHAHRIINSHELIFVIRGKLHIIVGEKKYVVSPGEALHIEPGVVHEGTQINTEPVSFYWLHFISSGNSQLLPPAWMYMENASRAEILCKQLLHCVNTEGYPRECADYFIRILLMELNVQQSYGWHALSNPLCAAVEEWIRLNCEQAIKVTDVAEYFNFNPDYLNRVFRKFHSKGIKSYIDMMRGERIKKELISGDLSLQEIARKYGFSDYKYFLKYFRLHEGVTPTEYRKAYYKTYMNC